MACYLLNRSLLILICITLGWLLVIFFENMALSFNSHCFLIILGLLRIFIMTGFCIVPIVLADKYPAQAQDNSATYFAIFGGIGILCNPIKGAILLMAARNAKNVQKSDWMPPPDHASTLNTNYTRSQKSEIL